MDPHALDDGRAIEFSILGFQNGKNLSCQSKGSPYCREADPSEMILPDGHRVEDLKTRPETCDAIKAETVPPDMKPMRRCWAMEAHDVRRLINAVAANACKENVHEQPVESQEENVQNQNQTVDEVDNGEKEDSDEIALKNASALLGGIERVSAEVPGDCIVMEKYLAEPIDLIGDTFDYEEMDPEDHATEALDSRGANANLDDDSVDSDLTDDEVSERSSSDEAPMQGAFCESEDNKLNESEVSEFSGPESEASVEEAKSETEAEISIDDFICAVIAGTSQLNDGFANNGEAQTVDESTYADKSGENPQAKLVIEEVEAKESLGSEMRVEEASSKNVDDDKERERARVKERKAVERAIREAHERAYVEARERAERAAVEKATAEARERGMTQAREKLGKSSSERSNREDDKIFVRAKLKAERAAVERATAEAREGALEKALAEKLAAGDKDYKPGKKSNEPQHRSTGPSSNLRRPSTFGPSSKMNVHFKP